MCRGHAGGNRRSESKSQTPVGDGLPAETELVYGDDRLVRHPSASHHPTRSNPVRRLRIGCMLFLASVLFASPRPALMPQTIPRRNR